MRGADPGQPNGVRGDDLLALRRRAEVLDVIFDAVIVKDWSERILDWNRGAERHYGWSRDEVLGKTCTEVLRTQYPISVEQVRAALLQRGHWEGELVRTRKDGTNVTVMGRCVLRRGAGGEPAEVVETCTDITGRLDLERMLAERTAVLEQREALFRGILEAAPDSIILVDERGVITLSNPKTVQIFGYSQEELVGQSIELLVPPRLRERHAGLRESYVHAPRSREMGSGTELSGVTKDGREFPIEASLSPLRLDGKLFVMAVVRDVTERKRAQAALLESEARLAEAQQVARIGSWSWDIAHGRMFWSDQNYRLIGLEPRAAEPTFELLLTRVAEEDRVRLRQVFERSLATHRPVALDFRVFLPDGRLATLNAEGKVLLDDEGRPMRMVGITRDVTEQRLVERMKDEFLSVVSHELRTPLNFIMGFSTLLEDEVSGPLNPKQHDYLGKILGGTDRMLVLINNLLDMSQIAAGSFKLSPSLTLYLPVVCEVISTLEPLIEEKRLTLTYDVQVTGEVPIDGQRIIQVLSNLVSNALKFTPEGGAIELRAYVNDGQLVTEVTDTGVGFEPDDLSRLFKRFTQLDMTYTRKVGGTGLGLSISKAIVEAHGGQIGACSAGRGQGATFWFTLPVTPHPQGAAPQSHAEEAS